MRPVKGVEQEFERGVMLHYEVARHGQAGLVFALLVTGQKNGCGEWLAWPDLTDGRAYVPPDTGCFSGEFPVAGAIGYAWVTFRQGVRLGGAISPPREFKGVCRRIKEPSGGWLLTDSWDRVLCLLENNGQYFLWDGMAAEQVWHTPWGQLKAQWRAAQE